MSRSYLSAGGEVSEFIDTYFVLKYDRKDQRVEVDKFAMTSERESINRAKNLATNSMLTDPEYRKLLLIHRDAYFDRDEIAHEQRMYNAYPDEKLSKLYDEAEKEIEVADAASDSYVANHLVTIVSPSDADIISKMGLSIQSVIPTGSLFAATTTHRDANIYLVYKVSQ